MSGKINSVDKFILLWGNNMTIYVALLRGINVGGHKVIKMADLKRLFESIELKHVKTYIQSGNIVFESEEGINFLKDRIQSEMKNEFDFDVPVMLRTHDEFINIIKQCPYEVHSLLEGESVHVAFLANVLSEEESSKLLTYKSFKIAYFVLVVIMFLLLIFSEGFSMGANLDGVKNLPLFIAICSSFFIYPIVELIVAKQYK